MHDEIIFEDKDGNEVMRQTKDGDIEITNEKFKEEIIEMEKKRLKGESKSYTTEEAKEILKKEKVND